MAKRTLKDKMTVGSGPDRHSTCTYFGRGHTNGDAFVVFPSLRVMHTGDICGQVRSVHGRRATAGAAWRCPDAGEGCRRLSNVGQIIPGHSTLMTPADMKEFAEFVKDFVVWAEAR